MRHFKTLSGATIELVRVTDLDEKTIIGFEPKRQGLTRILGKDLEICPKCELLGDGNKCDEHSL